MLRFRFIRNPLYRLGKFGWFINLLINLPRLVHYRWLLFAWPWRTPDVKVNGMWRLPFPTEYFAIKTGFATRSVDTTDGRSYFYPIRCTVCGSTRLRNKTTDVMEHIVMESELFCEHCGSQQGYWVTGYYYDDFIAEELEFYINAGEKLFKMFRKMINFFKTIGHAVRQLILVDYCNAIRRLTAGRINFQNLDVDTSRMKNVSDGYHTFDDLYRHRAALFAVVINTYKDYYPTWKSKQHHDGTMFDDMFIVGILSPRGQITYHYHTDKAWDLFDCPVVDRAPVWDGHTPEDCIWRLGSLHIPKYVYVLQAASKAIDEHMVNMALFPGIQAYADAFIDRESILVVAHKNYGLLNGAGTVALADFDFNALWRVLKVDAHPDNMENLGRFCRFTTFSVIAEGSLRAMASCIQKHIPKELRNAVIGSSGFDYKKHGIVIEDGGENPITGANLCCIETSRPDAVGIAGSYSYVRTGKNGRSQVGAYGHAVTHKTGMACAGIGGKITFEWRENDSRHSRTFEIKPGGPAAHVWYNYDMLCGIQKKSDLPY